jgi:excisionase family DNA binding protein
MADDQEIMTSVEVAKYLRIHPSTIYRLLRRKQIPAFRIGRDHRFLRSEIDQWMKEQTRKR